MQTVVIGGGIIGLATAYELARKGSEITVFERSVIGGSGSSERSAGGIRLQFSTPSNVKLSLTSMKTWSNFDAQFDFDIGFRRMGYLFVARDRATADQFRANVTMQNELGVESQLIEPVDFAKYAPGLNASPFIKGTYCGADALIDPHRALQGYARAAKEAGVTVRTETPVERIRQDATGQVRSVKTPEGTTAADYVVNAAGPWAREVAALADIELPLSLNRHQIAVIEPEQKIPDSNPLVVDMDTGVYFRPEQRGDALLGGYLSEYDDEQHPDNYATDIDLDWTQTVLSEAAEMTSFFGPEARVKSGWAGLTTHTPDDNPIIEESAPGVVNAVGFSGHGFQHAPAVGKVVASIVMDTKNAPIDTAVYSRDRFEATTSAASSGEENVI